MYYRSNELWGLNGREAEIASEVAQGKSNIQIAEEMHLSIQTVKWYVHRAFEAMQVTNRVQLARKWIIEVEKT